MRHLLFFILAIALGVGAASAQRVYRSEFTVYDAREDAEAKSHNHSTQWRAFNPVALGASGKTEVAGRKVEIPTAWSDYNVYLHIENTIKAYELVINGQSVGTTDDPYTPADYLISPYLKQGSNDILLLLRGTTSQLNCGAKQSLRNQFEGCYLYAQHRLHIYDYTVSILPDANSEMLCEMKVAIKNDFNYAEPVNVGYDIYSPEGKLIDYGVQEIVVNGRSIDTLAINAKLGNGSRNLWRNGSPKLYRATLYIKRDGKPREYIPFKIGAGESRFANGKILRNGTPITIKSAPYNARTSRKEAAADIAAFKRNGINTLCPDSPQAKWFYDLCDEAGIYVIEQANINPVEKSDDRTIGGTPSNNPHLLEAYRDRVRSMYWRTRNHPCIIAYSLGGEKAGNGYCMYKAYELLKELEGKRAVICRSADGEWNSDIDKLE